MVGFADLYLKEPNRYFFMFLAIAFIGINVDQKTAIILSFLTMADMAAFYAYKPTIRINGVSGNTPKAVITAIMATVGTAVLIMLAASLINVVQQLDLGWLFDKLGGSVFASENRLIFEGNPIFLFITGAVLVPIAETALFFGRLPEVLASMFRVDFKLDSGKMWVLAAIVSGIFVFYHFNVKGITDNISLIGTFVFAMVSMGLVMAFKELEPAVYLHNFWNGIILAKRLFIG